MKANIKQLFTSAVVASAFWSANAYAAPACGAAGSSNIRSLTVTVDVSASDIADGAIPAWTKVAETAQRQYGSRVEVGMISLIVKANVKLGPIGSTGYVGNFPMHFDGTTSIGRAIMNEYGVDKGGRDPYPCDPQKNACCDECGAMFGFMQPLWNIFNGGYQGNGIADSEQAVQLAEQKPLATGRRRMIG